MTVDERERNRKSQARWRARLKAAGKKKPQANGQYPKAVYVRLSQENHTKLRAFAAELNSSLAEAARVMLEEELDEWKSGKA